MRDVIIIKVNKVVKDDVLEDIRNSAISDMEEYGLIVLPYFCDISIAYNIAGLETEEYD